MHAIKEQIFMQYCKPRYLYITDKNKRGVASVVVVVVVFFLFFFVFLFFLCVFFFVGFILSIQYK